MAVSLRYILAAVAFAVTPGVAFAGCCTPSAGHPPVSVPTPTVPQPGPGMVSVPTPGGPPSQGCAPRCSPNTVHGPDITIPGPSVPTPSITVVTGGVNTSIQTFLNVSGSASAQGEVFIRGGGGVAVGGYGVDGGQLALAVTETAMETRTEMAEVAIQALCFDSRGNPHPASQTFADRLIPEGYQGEIYRCIAGTAMRVTLGRSENGADQFDGGQTFSCQAGEALVFRNNEVVCRTQEPRRQCNERSLLRRFGPGVKVARVQITRTVQTERTVAQQTSAAPAMSFGGGVGEGVW
jgi:hypothetical protein